MDDLDHSMHIAEYDWMNFCEESEECSMLQPSLACPDSSNLSDSEDSEFASPASSTGQPETLQSPDVNSDGAESNPAGCSTEESCMQLLVQLNKSTTEQEQDYVTTKTVGGSVTQEDCLLCSAGNTLNTKEVHMKISGEEKTNKPPTELLHVQCSGLSKELKKYGDLLIEIDNSINEPDPQILNQTKLNSNELHIAEGAVREDVSSAAATTEKERWFVTVNDSLARDQAHANSVKKKRRQKKPSKNSHMCNLRQEKLLEKGLEFKMRKYKNESQGGRDTWVQNLGGRLSAETNPESASDSSQINCEEGAMSEKLSFPHSFTKHITEPILDKNEPGGSTLHDTLNQKDPSQLENVELEELEDNVEFFLVHSYDSETYLSAAESVEEPHQPLEDHLMENQQLQSSVCLSTNSHLLNQTESVNTEDAQDRVLDSCYNTVSCHVSTTSYDGQRANKMSDDNSTRGNNTQNTVLCMPSHKPGVQKHKTNLSTSGNSSGNLFSPFPGPDLTVTPWSVADSLETYAQATGHTRPVYAISAFWDEMEKLTINDILQLRMVRNTPPSEPQETVTPNLDDSPTNCSSLVDTVECNLDASDTADSDYFTQPDEFKPHCSSCELSTSDFEEDYWQFISTSRNHSPNLQGKNQQRRCDSFFSHEEEEESTSSDGKATPVPSDDFAEQFTEHQKSHILGTLTQPRQISKSTSMYNVQALSTEDSALQALFGNDESSLFLSRCQSLEEKVSDSLETPTLMAFLSHTDILDEHYQIPLPELFEYFSTEDKATSDSRCVTVYDPEDISLSPVFDYTLCTFRDEMSFGSLHDSRCSEEKPIPIFSCSHPTVRELTLPKWDYVFLSVKCEEDMSPIRVMSRSFTQARDCGATAVGGSLSSKSWLTTRKICFHDKGSIWCQRSGAWVFPGEAENMIIKRKDPITVLSEGMDSSAPRELVVQQRILQTIPTSREGIFSTLKQSDMCLVCIAFASWVLRSSDPEAADAWKAALLANVSALSAIQYLRQYVKKPNPLQHDP